MSSAEASGFITRQLSQQAQLIHSETAALNMASNLRDEALELLNQEGHTHTFMASRVMGLAVLPLTILARFEITTPRKAVQRYLQADQATYIPRLLKGDGLLEPIMLFADDGDASRANSIQLGAWYTTEYLHIDTRNKNAEPLILCTQKDPRFPNIPVTDDSTGTRFDGSRARILRVASESDMQDYARLFTALKESDPETTQRLPDLKPPFGYLPLSPFQRMKS